MLSVRVVEQEEELRYGGAVEREQQARLIERIARRVVSFATRMIWDANHRPDAAEGDPKVGGHPAACSSAAHILSALHLGAREPGDLFAVKPHASPVDHALNHLLGLFHEPMGRRWLDAEESKAVMGRLRAFSKEGEPVFQSYHSGWDPDGDYYFPSGSVGIPPVVSMYTALAYRYAAHHGMEVPAQPHFWSLMGDSEFREGSLMEALPEAAERELANVTWIVDYNRQNLDGTRMPNPRGLRGTDADRMERVARANGWEVIQLRHGRKRASLFAREGGEGLRDLLENGLSDYAFQTLLLRRSAAATREHLLSIDRRLEGFLSRLSDEELSAAFEDLGGHDVLLLLEALGRCRSPESISPTLIVAHTIKGWGLPSLFAAPGNHSALPPEEEVHGLLREDGLSEADPFALFAPETEEGQFLSERGARLRQGIEDLWGLRDRNLAAFEERLKEAGGFPDTLGLELKYLPLVHTQYVWGQLAAKLIRVGNLQEADRKGKKQRPLTELERRWGPAAELVVTMAPDVGTSTSINPAMDDKVYGPKFEQDLAEELGVKDPRRPDLLPHEEAWTRHLRFEIAEANCMSAAGAFGKLREQLGIPFLPVMTIYDFFIKRAFDQLYYNLYWGANFIVIGTPSGVTLSPEGAQHSWKSDIQMPNLITWEPFFAVEMDWILSESVRRAAVGDTEGRSGVLIRGVTRAFRQAELSARLSQAKRFEGMSEGEMLELTRRDALEGAYYLVDYRGFEGYDPGENVVHIFSMGAMGSEALLASDRRRQDGIFANVISVTSADLLCGSLAERNRFRHLRKGLGITGDLHLRGVKNGKSAHVVDRADWILTAGRRTPIVAVVDGEPGLLDNLGSVVGCRAETLAVRKASKCGRPPEVYRYLGIDQGAVVQAAGRVLAETALDNLRISKKVLASLDESPSRASIPPEELWPPRR